MFDRRRFITGTFGLCLGQAGLTALPGRAAAATSYEGVAAEIRRPRDPANAMHEIVRYATLAANSHNTQPWRFYLKERTVEILPDLTRRCPAVDPDDHHLFVSLGCAAENAALAAAALGFESDVSTLADGNGIRIELRPAQPRISPLLEAIPRRQSTRTTYDRSSVSAEEARILAAAADGPGVSGIVITDDARKEKVLEYIIAGNTAQMRDPAFVDELRNWIRFNNGEALATRDGLSSSASGNPNLPSWLAKLVFGFVFTESGENDKYREQVRSSAGIVVLASAANDKSQWIEVGRVCQRLGLQATAMGLKYAFVNQAVEHSPTRKEFASYLGLKEQRPDIVVRFGRGPSLSYSLRRPVQDVIA